VPIRIVDQEKDDHLLSFGQKDGRTLSRIEAFETRIRGRSR
jgi:hypothetical protein